MGEGGGCHGGERFGSFGPLDSDRRDHGMAFACKTPSIDIEESLG